MQTEYLRSRCNKRRDAAMSDPEPVARDESDACLSRWRRLQLLDVLVGGQVEVGGQSSRLSRDVAEWTLAYAAGFSERTAAVRIAMALGMPLNRIQEYLDWLDAAER